MFCYLSVFLSLPLQKVKMGLHTVVNLKKRAKEIAMKCSYDVIAKFSDHDHYKCIGFNTPSPNSWDRKTKLIKPVLLSQELRKGRLEPDSVDLVKKEEKPPKEKPNRHGKGQLLLETESWQDRTGYN